MIFRSPFRDVVIPDLPLHEHVLGRAEELGDKPAFIDALSGEATSYAELSLAVRGAALGLAERGFAHGDTIALCSPNLPVYGVAFLAASALGGVVTTMNPLMTATEMARQLIDSNARVAVVVPPLLEKMHEAIGTEIDGARPRVEQVYVFGEADGAERFTSLLRMGAARLAAGDDVPPVDIDPRADVVALPYSSGTTGLPKGVMLTHRNLVANIEQMLAADQIPLDEVLIAVLPFFHIYGMVLILGGGLARGNTIVTLPRFDLEEFLGVLAERRVTRAHIVPPILLALAKHPAVDNFDFSALRCVFVGAAPVSPEIAEACEARIGCRVRQGYGLTEASPLTHCTPIADEHHRSGSAGPPVPGTEVKIADLESGEALEPGAEGEILVRGPQVMKGYLNAPEATAATLDDDGWLHTGDIGRCDPDGWVYLVDRAKELIKYKGYQVAPAELESLLVAHPEVADAAVIPKADEEAGEIPKAFVVRSGEVSGEALMDYVAAEVAPYKKLREVEFIDEIPKSASGKILRRVLRDRESAS